MFGLMSNNFTLPESDIDDYVQYDVTLHNSEFTGSTFTNNITSLGFHLCTEADEKNFFEPLEY